LQRYSLSEEVTLPSYLYFDKASNETNDEALVHEWDQSMTDRLAYSMTDWLGGSSLDWLCPKSEDI